ncbi:MAG: NAD(P)H-dependent oxidoreductase [Pseudomonadota bacterium]
MKISVWVGHPRQDSLSHGMADAFTRGAEEAGADVRRQNLFEMDFDPDLQEGYHARKQLEPCLVQWRENIQWANHLCWAYPVWWGSMPAKMKGVVDRAFLPGFAMEYPEGNPFWRKLLKGRSADILLTSDAPAWFDQISNRRPAMNQATHSVLNFSGIKPVRTLQVGTVKTANEKKIQSWLDAAYRRGLKAGRA